MDNIMRRDQESTEFLSDSLHCKQLQDPNSHPYIRNFQDLVSFENEDTAQPNWSRVYFSDTCEVFRKSANDSNVCIIKAFCTLNYPIDVIYKAIWDPEIRVAWDKIFLDYKVEKNDEFSEFLYFRIKSPPGITQRDWIQRRTMIKNYPEHGSITMHSESIDHPDYPVLGNVIRAETKFSGYILRPLENGRTKLTIISQNDIKGGIPKKLVSFFAGRTPKKWLKTLSKSCNRLMNTI
ncbi:unnamed protein product [Blepharisma stoltei]|uniref:START domain-containing protein n=1 Tax=Blepharisma stoltei TaxID=1481888 RepID=A0AAU9J430_9CILI|nr:unnamed protein product [Blepharisma stoltei]